MENTNNTIKTIEVHIKTEDRLNQKQQNIWKFIHYSPRRSRPKNSWKQYTIPAEVQCWQTLVHCWKNHTCMVMKKTYQTNYIYVWVEEYT